MALWCVAESMTLATSDASMHGSSHRAHTDPAGLDTYSASNIACGVPLNNSGARNVFSKFRGLCIPLNKFRGRKYIFKVQRPM